MSNIRLVPMFILVLFQQVSFSYTSPKNCQRYVFFTPFKTPDQIESDSEREAHGWYWRCELLNIGGLKNNQIDLLSILANRGKLGPESIDSCYNGYGKIEENDWRPFFKMWECLKTPRKNREEILRIVKYCKGKFKISRFQDIKTISELKNMTEVDKDSFGCITKCYYEEMASYKNGVFDVVKFVRSGNATREVIHHVEECHAEANKKYKVEERYSCRYFFDLDLCSLDFKVH